MEGTIRGKQRKEREEEILELKNIKNKAEVWKYINKRRGRREPRINSISRTEWREYFKEILEGTDKDEDRESDRKEGQTIEEQEERKRKKNKQEVKDTAQEIEEEEICRVVMEMKKKKATGVAKIFMEAYI